MTDADKTLANSPTSNDDSFLMSSFYEQLVEHIFISELLQDVWFRFGQPVEVLHGEVDAYGYDLVLTCNGCTRHVQLKTTEVGANSKPKPVNISLADKPSGCVILLVRQPPVENRIGLQYRFFGNGPNESLPCLSGYKNAPRSKKKSDDERPLRQSTKLVKIGDFSKPQPIGELVKVLFGLSGTDDSEASQ